MKTVTLFIALIALTFAAEPLPKIRFINAIDGKSVTFTSSKLAATTLASGQANAYVDINEPDPASIDISSVKVVEDNTELVSQLTNIQWSYFASVIAYSDNANSKFYIAKESDRGSFESSKSYVKIIAMDSTIPAISVKASTTLVFNNVAPLETTSYIAITPGSTLIVYDPANEANAYPIRGPVPESGKAYTIIFTNGAASVFPDRDVAAEVGAFPDSCLDCANVGTPACAAYLVDDLTVGGSLNSSALSVGVPYAEQYPFAFPGSTSHEACVTPALPAGLTVGPRASGTYLSGTPSAEAPLTGYTVVLKGSGSLHRTVVYFSTVAVPVTTAAEPPATTGSVPPATTGEAPATTGDVPATTGEAPVTTGEAPVSTSGDVPVTTGEAPVATSGDVPPTTGSAPTTGSVPATTGSAPVTPATTGSAPAGTTGIPAPATTGAVNTDPKIRFVNAIRTETLTLKFSGDELANFSLAYRQVSQYYSVQDGTLQLTAVLLNSGVSLISVPTLLSFTDYATVAIVVDKTGKYQVIMFQEEPSSKLPSTGTHVRLIDLESTIEYVSLRSGDLDLVTFVGFLVKTDYIRVYRPQDGLTLKNSRGTGAVYPVSGNFGSDGLYTVFFFTTASGGPAAQLTADRAGTGSSGSGTNLPPGTGVLDSVNPEDSSSAIMSFGIATSLVLLVAAF